ncbi:MAG: lipase maturation factor family protein [Ignavibacteriota bacterium]
MLWLSLCSVGQDFYAFPVGHTSHGGGVPGDLRRTGPGAHLAFPRAAVSSDVLQRRSEVAQRDSVWRNFTALTYHYYTQPLPTPVAWYLQQLPDWFDKASAGFVFAVELVAPFLFFAPRRLRHVGAWLTITLQVLILLTGNYTFFNYLTIALCMWLFIEPDDHSKALRGVTLGLAVPIGLLSGLTCMQLFTSLPAGGDAVLRAVDPLRIVNTYGLFAIMTTARQRS